MVEDLEDLSSLQVGHVVGGCGVVERNNQNVCSIRRSVEIVIRCRFGAYPARYAWSAGAPLYNRRQVVEWDKIGKDMVDVKCIRFVVVETWLGWDALLAVTTTGHTCIFRTLDQD